MICSTRTPTSWRPLTSCTALFALALLSSSAQAINGGTATTDFKNVSDGVQFAPNWVLSASHVGFGVNGTYTNGHGSALIDAVYLAPGASGLNNDLVLVHLASPINSAPVLQLSSTVLATTTLDWLNPSLNVDVTLSTDSNQAPRGYAHAQLREFAGTLFDDHDNDPNTPELEYVVNWYITHQNNLGSPYVQSGDSGGGLFLGHVTDNTSPLLGLGSALLFDLLGPDTNTFASAYVSVASYRSFIDNTMMANLADDQMPNWVGTLVPEPATWALWLTAGVAGVWWRRRLGSAEGASR